MLTIFHSEMSNKEDVADCDYYCRNEKTQKDHVENEIRQKGFWQIGSAYSHNRHLGTVRIIVPEVICIHLILNDIGVVDDRGTEEYYQSQQNRQYREDIANTFSSEN